MRVTIDLMKKSTQIIDLSNVINPRVGDDDLLLPLHICYGDNLYDMRENDVEFLTQDTNKNNIYIAGTCNTNTPGDNLYTGDLTFRFPAGTFKVDGTYDPDQTMFRIVDKATQKVISSVNVKITVMKNAIEFNFDPDKSSYDSRAETMLQDFHDKGQAMLDEIKDLNNQAKSNASGDTAATANAAKKQAYQNAGDISDLKGEVAGARGRFADLPGREDAQDTAISQKENIADANANYAALQQKDAQQDAAIAQKAGKFELEDKLSRMDLQPEAFENEAALKAKYPNGKSGLMVTADTGHKYIWSNGSWTDAGIYQAVGIADGSVTGKQIANNSIQADKLEDVFIENLVKLPNQTPMQLSVNTFSNPVNDSVNGFIYIQNEPVLGYGPLKFSVVANLAGDYNFYTLEKIYIDANNFKMKITATETVTLTAGLNEFQSSLTASGGVTYYGMQIKNGTPMQRVNKEYPPAFASNTTVKGEIGEEFDTHKVNLAETGNTETEGFFAELENQIDVKTMDNITQQASDFLTYGTTLHFDPENAKIVQQPTTPTGDGLQQIDPDSFTFWGIRLANQNKKFNGFNLKMKLSTLDYKIQRYRFCGIVKSLKTDKISYSYTDINPLVNYDVPTYVCFKFNQNFNLSDDLIIGVSIVDLNNQVTSTNSTGAILTNGIDNNLYNDGTNLKNAIYYTLAPGDVRDIDWVNAWLNNSGTSAKNYSGLDYQLLDGDIALNYSVLDSTINANAQLIKSVSDQVKLLMNRRQMQLKLVENGDSFGFVGRWWTEKDNDKDYHMTNNDGSEVFFRTSGSETITPIWYKKGIATNVYYAYSIDNGPINRVLTGTAITIGDQQEHIVRLTVDGVTEGDGKKWSGNYAIGFGGLSENVQTTGLLPHSPLIHFYGDSITEGVRALGITTTGDMGDTNSVTGSYSYMTAKKLTAAPYIVGYGATGIEATGSFNTLINTISNLCDGKNLTVKQEPDLIVVNMGTNDASNPAQQFSNDYTAAINHLRVMYPGVQIACMVPFNQTHANDIASAIAGIPECSLISTEGWAADMEFADGTHPTVKGAEVASDKLAQALISNNLI